MDAPATASTWSRLVAWTRRGLGLVESPPAFVAGADYTPATAQGQTYEVEQALSAFAAFAWVRACVDAIATDLAGLPLVVSRGRGSEAERIDDHPVLDRLDQPTTWQTGEEWRRQLVVYLLLTGNAYALRLAGDASLPLLHPERVKVRPGPFGGPEGYTYGLDQAITYAPASVIHWRLASWQSNPEALLGAGLIQALHHDLSADLAASKLAAKQATQGRPPAVISPADGGEISDPATREAIARSYAALVAKGDAAMVLSGAVKLDFPTYTPRDMEFQAQRTLTRETILAAFGVPPTRVGLPTANYATAQQQDRTYWTGLQGLARLLDGQLSRLVGRGERVLHDFSGVEALQESRTERLNRVLTWTMLGATEADAAAYEGFHDAPVATVEEGAAPAIGGATAVADTALNGAQISSLLEILAAVASGALDAAAAVALIGVAFPTIDAATAARIVSGTNAVEPAPPPADPQQQGLAELFVVRSAEAPATSTAPAPTAPDMTTEEGRTARWQGWLARAWTPSEARLHRATRAALRAQAQRIAARLDEGQARGMVELSDRWKALVTRNLVSDLLSALMPSDEDAALRDALREALAAVLSAGYRETSTALGGALRWEPTRRDSATEAQLAELVARVNATTREAIRRIITEGLDQGATIAEMQQRIQRAAAFGPSRALMVARTETTRGVEAGSAAAYSDADKAGVRVRVQWLSARDGAVRDAHRELDGQTVAVGEAFAVDGQRARYPGDFADPGMSINCRCTTVPVVEDAA